MTFLRLVVQTRRKTDDPGQRNLQGPELRCHRDDLRQESSRDDRAFHQVHTKHAGVILRIALLGQNGWRHQTRRQHGNQDARHGHGTPPRKRVIMNALLNLNCPQPGPALQPTGRKNRKCEKVPANGLLLGSGENIAFFKFRRENTLLRRATRHK